jgi:hypothetical protein
MSNVTISLHPETEQKLRKKAADEGRSLEALIADLAKREANIGFSRDLTPLALNRIEHGEMVYSLRKPLLVDVEYLDGYWTLRNDALNLWGSDTDRSGALIDLQANFDYVWHEIACEADETLDAKACAIKEQLRGLVIEESAS